MTEMNNGKSPKFGVFLAVEPFHRTASEEYWDIVALAQQCEALGYNSLWLASRHFSPEYAAAPSPLVLLAAAATQTRSINLGTSIVSLPLENPIRLAEDFATLDAISNGRGRLGLGSGDDPPAFSAFGLDFDQRQGMLSENLPRLLDILEGKPLGGVGLYPRVENPRAKVGLGAQSARGAAWAAFLGIGLLQGRAEPNTLDPTASQVRAAQTYREIHPAGWVVTARNAWVGSADDPELLEALHRHDSYLRSRGRPGLPDDRHEAIKKVNILAGEPEALAEELLARVSPISPDELLVTVDPGGLQAADRAERLATLAKALQLTP